jgi:hypothetical protein
LFGWATVVRSPRGELVSFPVAVAPPGPAQLTTELTNAQRAVATRCARAINRAATYGPLRPRCLARSLGLQRMLERHGVPGSVVRIGVRLQEKEFFAHAWVELEGLPLGESAPVETFVQLNDAGVQTRLE